MTGLLIAIIAAPVVVGCMIGFAVWDSRRIMKPLLKRPDERSVRAEKLERVLKEYAREDPRLAEILKRVGMVRL